MATRSLSEVEYAEMIAAKSKYDRAAAAWVAQEVRKTVDWVEQYPEAPLLNPYYITDITIKTVGDYHYSEMTFDEGDAGLSYTFWEPRVVAKGQHKGTTRLYPVSGMEIRWYGDGMSAGRFIEECVALLGKEYPNGEPRDMGPGRTRDQRGDWGAPRPRQRGHRP